METDNGDNGMVSLGGALFRTETMERMPEKLKQALLTKSGESARLSKREMVLREVEWYNASRGFLNEFEEGKPPRYPAYDCPKCQNRGDFAKIDETGNIAKYECECMNKRRYLRNIRESGLSELLRRYTLENWQCRERWQADLLSLVTRYAERPQGWLCLSGRPGTGKTHLCTALCGVLLERGFPVRYMLWKDVSVRAKALVNDEEAYAEIITPLKRARVLYIDDFFKTGRAMDRATGNRAPGQPTNGDVNFACDLLYARYNDSSLLTVISTEMELGDMMYVDEGLASRIIERTRGRYQSLAKMPNWRMRNGRI